MSEPQTVLVTGGSGFIAAHCILQLLQAGYRVRTTVRKLEREPEVRATLHSGGVDAGERLSFHAADLESDAGWPAAVAGCDYVLHVASPFPQTLPKHEDELIVPAREGAVRVLRAARDAGVKRVVLTSSFAAVGYGHAPRQAPYDEQSWTDADHADVPAYPRSKTLAERAAWQFIEQEGRGLELSVVNPVLVLGPVLTADFSTSVLVIQKMLDGAMPGAPKLWYGVVDVRDVADLHLRAMTHPAAKGERFLAVSGDFLSILQMAHALKDRVGGLARRVPSFEVPSFLVRTASLWAKSVSQILPDLGKHKNATNEKAKRLLGWSPRSPEDALLATAESLQKLGLLKGQKKSSPAMHTSI